MSTLQLQLTVRQPPRGPASAVLNQQSPWWETEARKIVWSGPIELVYQLLRFRFYSRKDSLRHEIIARLTNEGKTVKLVEPNRPSPNLWSWDPRQTEGFNVEQIAEAIDRGGLSQLAHVQFEDCLGHALGYTERSVEHVVIQYRCIVFRIRCYIREYPMVAGIYQKVEEVGYLVSTFQSPTDSSSYCETETPWLIKPCFMAYRLRLQRTSASILSVNH